MLIVKHCRRISLLERLKFHRTIERRNHLFLALWRSRLFGGLQIRLPRVLFLLDLLIVFTLWCYPLLYGPKLRHKVAVTGVCR